MFFIQLVMGVIVILQRHDGRGISLFFAVIFVVNIPLRHTGRIGTVKFIIMNMREDLRAGIAVFTDHSVQFIH